jgi:hypothetical protein
MEIIRFDNDQSRADEFVAFPGLLYGDDPRYISPSRQEQYQFVRPDGRFYQSGDIQATHFLACDDGQVVGRISAFVNRQLCDSDGNPIGTLGLFECREEFGFARELFTAGIDWLVSKHHIRTIWGSMNGDIWHGYRVMTRGFDQEPFVGEPYNKSYYPSFFERFGFSVRQEWDSVEIEGADSIKKMIGRGKQRSDLLQAQGYRFESWSSRDRESQIQTLHQVMCESYRGFLGFTPIPLAQFACLFKQMEAALDPDLFMLAYDPEGRCAGFAVAFPDLAEAVRSMHGNGNLPARLRFLLHRRNAHRLNFYIGGVVPEQEARATGLGRAGFYYIINRGLKKGFTNLLLTLRLKGNKAHGLAARSGVVPQREYALYEYRYGN